MGTRALLIVNKKDVNVSNVFVSGDGYLDGFGSIIEKYIKRKHVNGYTDALSQYNRIGNLIALIVSEVVISNTDSQRRVGAMFGHKTSEELACGSVEIVADANNLIQDCDYAYTLNFTCDIDNPKQPKIKVTSYGFDSGWITVDDFSKLIIDGIPDDDE